MIHVLLLHLFHTWCRRSQTAILLCSCSPSTGKLLVYGLAMARHNVEVELPSVQALFNNISSRVSQKSLDPSCMPHARVSLPTQHAVSRLAWFVAMLSNSGSSSWALHTAEAQCLTSSPLVVPYRNACTLTGSVLFAAWQSGT